MKNGIYTLDKTSRSQEIFKGALYRSDEEKRIIKTVIVSSLQELKSRLSEKITDEIHEVEVRLIDEFIEEINAI